MIVDSDQRAYIGFLEHPHSIRRSDVDASILERGIELTSAHVSAPVRVSSQEATDQALSQWLGHGCTRSTLTFFVMALSEPREDRLDFTKRDQARVGAAIERHSAPPAPRKPLVA